MKKLLLSLGTIAAIATPIATTIACGYQAKVLESTKNTEELEKQSASISWGQGDIESFGTAITAQEVNETLGINEFQNTSESKNAYVLANVIDSDGIFILTEVSLKDENLISTDPLDNFDNIDYKFFIVKSANSEEDNLDKANKMIETSLEQIEKARELLE